jgi:hypothetical protein
MNLTIYTALSFALLLAVACLVRETKLRRSLQRLLARLFNLWRSPEHEEDANRNPASSGPRRGRL